jgi:hypothetical protein
MLSYLPPLHTDTPITEESLLYQSITQSPDPMYLSHCAFHSPLNPSCDVLSHLASDPTP